MQVSTQNTFIDSGSFLCFACSVDTSTLTKKLKNLQANSAALSSLQTKLNATASSRFYFTNYIQNNKIIVEKCVMQVIALSLVLLSSPHQQPWYPWCPRTLCPTPSSPSFRQLSVSPSPALHLKRLPYNQSQLQSLKLLWLSRLR